MVKDSFNLIRTRAETKGLLEFYDNLICFNRMTELNLLQI